ncbi:Hypothetical predicted protein [Podarcis lilfordi]|uniref:Uncharacterized protein n=1 Tax=Podarcis lilfordi TaxID=74358 RepID=A0AA35L2M5_9SAUR|nr:Hypothetical predicted protein [Podarcis lilfordi]
MKASFELLSLRFSPCLQVPLGLRSQDLVPLRTLEGSQQGGSLVPAPRVEEDLLFRSALEKRGPSLGGPWKKCRGEFARIRVGWLPPPFPGLLAPLAPLSLRGGGTNASDCQLPEGGRERALVPESCLQVPPKGTWLAAMRTGAGLSAPFGPILQALLPVKPGATRFPPAVSPSSSPATFLYLWLLFAAGSYQPGLLAGPLPLGQQGCHSRATRCSFLLSPGAAASQPQGPLAPSPAEAPPAPPQPTWGALHLPSGSSLLLQPARHLQLGSLPPDDNISFSPSFFCRISSIWGEAGVGTPQPPPWLPYPSRSALATW